MGIICRFNAAPVLFRVGHVELTRSLRSQSPASQDELGFWAWVPSGLRQAAQRSLSLQGLPLGFSRSLRDGSELVACLPDWP